MSKLKYLREKKKLIIEGLVASFLVAFVFAAILPKVFADTAYYLAEAAVELDGANDETVMISFNTPIADSIYSIEGNFQTSDEDHYFTLTTLTPASGITPSSNTVVDGRIVWQDGTWMNPLVLGERESMWSATYTVDKDTPAGQYTLHLYGAWVASLSEGYNTADLGDLTATVTVTRDDAPAVKPSQVMTFRDGEGNAFTEITKYYGDEDFTVTKELTTGDGAILEYHPDDDGTGSIAHTYPTGDMVGVGIPGDVEICAWIDETENYAATKACYTVHVLKRPLDIVGAVIADKTYDGTTDATVTSVSFEDKVLNNEEYTATASFEEADAGENVVVHVSVALAGNAVDYYVLNASNYNTTKTISPYLLTAQEVGLSGGNTYSYNPNGVEPGVTVTASIHGGVSTLVLDDDYEVAYSDNMGLGTGHASVTGKGNFTTGANPIVLDFTIEARGINSSNLVAPNTIVEGRILTPDDIDINVDGVDLVRCDNDGDPNCDYVLSITGNTGLVGDTVNVMAEGRNNYTGVAGKDISIVAKLEQTVSFSGVTGDIEKTYGDADFTYTATTNGDGAITYTSSDNNVATVNLNSGLVEIVGVGEVNITATAAETDTYAVASASYHVVVSKRTITVSSVTVSDKTYDGNTDATVTNAILSDDDLLLGDGFSIDEAHFTNANAGNYNDVYVLIKLDDDAYELYQFSGNAKTAETTGSATIEAFTLDDDNTTAALSNTAYTYDGEEKEPTATVTVDLNGDGTKETVLNAGTDYEISYSNNANAGTATATITGKGNYAGSLSALEFTISTFTLTADNASAALASETFTYDGEAKEPTATVVVDLDGDGTKETTLTAGTDYEISYNNNMNAGTATATIAGKGNYAGSLSALEFTINKADSGEPENTPSDLAGEVGDTLADLGDLPEGFSWVDDSTVITAGMNDYPVTYTKDGDTDNYNTTNMTIPVLGYTGEYEVIKGAGQEYIIGESESALFEIDADYELFEEGGAVYVDNELVEPANYEASSGSTIITFSKEYMDGLALGEHSLAVLFNDGGVARTTFTVTNPAEPEEDEPGAANTGVFTGANGGAIATGLTAIMVASLAGAAYVMKKRNN